MKISSLNNKTIALLGFGVTGKEVYKSLQRHYQITIVNDKPVAGYETYTYKQVEDIDFDIIIKSPGVPYSHPLLINSNARVTNDIELCFEAVKENQLSTQIIAITGTNGKTTTTQFICDILNRAGETAIACGNIGQSPLFVLEQTLNVDYLVMELSSYQLKQVDKFQPNAALFLNITPDHIDYHGSFEDYLKSKCNIFKNMNANDILVLDYDMTVEYPHIDWPSFASYGARDEVLANVSVVTMPKRNYKLIFDLLQSLGIDKEFITSELNQFKGLEHRLEVVDSKYDFQVINDSKATNVMATNVAINNLNCMTTLIVGGSIKVEDYTLLDYKNKNLKLIIAYGAAKEKFDFIPNVQMYDDFSTAVKSAIKQTSANEVLLLSPACASFDQHSSYAERGEMFKQIIRGTNE